MVPAHPVLRFAPSPNGFLHLGHALSALENRRMADRLGGRLLLRIEDIDSARCRPEFETAMVEDLAWLGIDFAPHPRRQSEHLGSYRSALDRLAAQGLVLVTRQSRAEIKAHAERHAAETQSPWPRDPDGALIHPGGGEPYSPDLWHGEEKGLQPFVLRLDMAKALARLAGPLTWTEIDDAGLAERMVTARPERWGNVVLARRDVPTSYHLAVVTDDADQGVTHVVRGQDLFEATAVHRLLQALLGLPEPAYRHHRLVLGADGRKLSKSEQSTGLRMLRDGGATPAEIRQMLGFTA